MIDEATKRNIMAIKQHSDFTRELVRGVEDKLKQVEALENQIKILQEQMKSMQVKIYSGGATG